MKTVTGVLASMCVAISALAGTPEHQKAASRSSKQNPQVAEETLFVTGSLIPRRIQVQRVGTTTESPLRLIDHREIDQTGRMTTPGAFVNEPAVRIIGH